MANFGHCQVMQFKVESIADRTVRGLASTPMLDRVGEIIVPGAFSDGLPAFLENPLMFWMHESRSVPIGHIPEASVAEEGLRVAASFNKTEMGEEVWTAVEHKDLRSFSIGFDGSYDADHGFVLEDEEAAEKAGLAKFIRADLWEMIRNVWVWTKVQLREISVVTMPANTAATFSLAKSLGLAGPREALTQPRPAPTPAAEHAQGVEKVLAKLVGHTELLRRACTHWETTGEEPSGRLVAAALDPLAAQIEVVKAGRVLSAKNRGAVESARDALNDVLERDTPSVDAAGTEAEDKGLSIAGLRIT